MLLLLLNLLQQARVSRFVIIAAVLLFIAVVSLLVYFFRRYQRVEKSAEDDWDQSRSLFVNVPAPHKTEEPGTATVTPAPAIESGSTLEFASPAHSETLADSGIEPPQVEVAAHKPERQPEPVKPEPAAPVEVPGEDRMTQVLASPRPLEAKTETEPDHEHATFDEDVWADLEVEEPPEAPEAGATIPLHAIREPLPSARVNERSHREPFESPRIERMTHRETYEPPSIEPLAPRGQDAATRDLHAAAPPRTSAKSPGTEDRPSRDTVIFGTKASERDTQPRTAEPVVAGSPGIAEPSVAGTRSYRTPAGSVLGIPAEPSQGPLILGEPVRPESEAGIGALTNYGKDLSPKSGRGGTITLLIVIALLAGSALVYLFVPAVHGRVNAFVGRLRGVDTQASAKPKAQIFPSYRPEVNKNMVTARGAIDNISDDPLENLEVEISLQRGGDAPPEVRKIPVTPDSLEPGGRGTFSFEYDGKRDTGFVGYKITKLYSKGIEIKFRTPNPK